MSPYQHGEVFVTRDGQNRPRPRHYDVSSMSAYIGLQYHLGQIYSSVIAKGAAAIFRRPSCSSAFDGEIKQHFKRLSEQSQADVIIVEVGGTVGDIEGQPFLEAIRQMRKDVGRDNVLYMHVTLLPHINSTRELKTKPTQHSVNELRRIGIQPDVIVCRSDYPISEQHRDKYRFSAMSNWMP